MGSWFKFQHRPWFYGTTREEKHGRAAVAPAQAASYSRRRKRREASRDGEPSYGEAKRADSRRRETVPSSQIKETVPQTDTGRRDEQSKALERTRVKELGKMRT